MKQLNRLFAALVILGVLLSACGSAPAAVETDPPRQTRAPRAEAPAAETGAPAAETPAPAAPEETAEPADFVRAATMRLMRAVGRVTLTDADGADIPVREGARLYSGSSVETEAESRAGLGLDDTKAATVGAESLATVSREGRHLALTLERGELYFSVSRPLDPDESFEIGTGTMTLGIRGTSGYVAAVGESKAAVVLTSGHVTVTAATGETRELSAGGLSDAAAGIPRRRHGGAGGGRPANPRGGGSGHCGPQRLSGDPGAGGAL